MERIFGVFDPRTNCVRSFQGVELPQRNKNYHRLSGVFVDGSNLMVIALVDEKNVIQGYEENGLVVMKHSDAKPPKVKRVRRTRVDKGVKRGKRVKK
jgi:hypothetical protein